MTKPLPTDVQMLALMNDEHAMNNKLFEKMDSMDEAMKYSMESFSGNVQSLNQTLAGGFAMLRDILQQPASSHSQPFHAGAYNFSNLQNNSCFFLTVYIFSCVFPGKNTLKIDKVYVYVALLLQDFSYITRSATSSMLIWIFYPNISKFPSRGRAITFTLSA